MADETAPSNAQRREPIRVLLIDDHKVVAESIGTLLETSDGIEVVGRVFSPDKIISSITGIKPDIVICDLEMPGGDPLDLAAEALRDLPDTKLMVLTAYPTDAHIARAAKAGVRAFLTKHEPAETIVDAIHAVMSGHIIFSDDVRQRIADGTEGFIESKVLKLSPRELTIVRLVAQGMTTPQIAEKVFRSPKTVDNQISSAMGKTGSANRVELSRWAIREGLVQA